MTAHPIDTDALRARLAPLAWHSTPPITTDHVRRVLDALAAAEHRATRAEARVKAVEDVLDDGTWTGLSSGKDWVSATTIRRALEG